MPPWRRQAGGSRRKRRNWAKNAMNQGHFADPKAILTVSLYVLFM
jgi:hypothetical protein